MTAANSAPRSTVLGLDGSPGSAHALEWALGHPDLTGTIRPVAAWRVPWWAVTPPMAGVAVPPPMDDLSSDVRTAAEAMLAGAPREAHTDVLVIRGSAGPALVEAVESADLLVVGTRGRGAAADNLLGSVSSHCVAHSTKPVVVVPAEADTKAPIRTVVVGVDGSDQSANALVWALTTTPADAEIVALKAWSFAPYAGFEVTAIDPALIEDQAKHVLADTVSKALATAGVNRTVTQELVAGDPRTVLKQRGGAADLLVLGDRGHRGVVHLLVGSVTTAVAHHPPVPLAVIPFDAA